MKLVRNKPCLILTLQSTPLCLASIPNAVPHRTLQLHSCSSRPSIPSSPNQPRLMAPSSCCSEPSRAASVAWRATIYRWPSTAPARLSRTTSSAKSTSSTRRRVSWRGWWIRGKVRKTDTLLQHVILTYEGIASCRPTQGTRARTPSGWQRRR